MLLPARPSWRRRRRSAASSASSLISFEIRRLTISRSLWNNASVYVRGGVVVACSGLHVVVESADDLCRTVVAFCWSAVLFLATLLNLRR